jgi:hypothetical protein
MARRCKIVYCRIALKPDTIRSVKKHTTISQHRLGGICLIDSSSWVALPISSRKSAGLHNITVALYKSYPLSPLCSRFLGRLSLRPPRSLLQQTCPPRSQDSLLSLFHTHQPVAERAACASEDGVHPEGSLVEERTHLEAELPDADCEAYFAMS